MKIESVKKVTVHLDGKEAKTLKILFGLICFNNCLDILGSKESAADTQDLIDQIFYALDREGF